MKIYTLLSTFVHILVISLLFLNLQTKDTEKIDENKQQGGSHILSFDIIQQNDLTDLNDIKIEKNYYWGLGITVNYDGVNLNVIGVDDGYNGQLSGLLVGDMIVLVNDKPISGNNDIAGDSPKKLKLTIMRKDGNIINIFTERCKVWYTKH
jgi:hypothetical protein